MLQVEVVGLLSRLLVLVDLLVDLGVFPLPLGEEILNLLSLGSGSSDLLELLEFGGVKVSIALATVPPPVMLMATWLASICCSC